MQKKDRKILSSNFCAKNGSKRSVFYSERVNAKLVLKIVISKSAPTIQWVNSTLKPASFRAAWRETTSEVAECELETATGKLDHVIYSRTSRLVKKHFLIDAANIVVYDPSTPIGGKHHNISVLHRKKETTNWCWPTICDAESEFNQYWLHAYYNLSSKYSGNIYWDCVRNELVQ